MKVSLITGINQPTRTLVTLAATGHWNSLCYWYRCASRIRADTVSNYRHTFNTQRVLLRSTSSTVDDDENRRGRKLSNDEQVSMMRQQLNSDDQNVISLSISQVERKNAWDSLWRDNTTPWDLGKPTPVLISELESHWNEAVVHSRTHDDDDTTFRSLIPGCGAGYDLVTLALHHDKWIRELPAVSNLKPNSAVVVGLDISDTSLMNRASTVVESGIQNESLQNTHVDLMSGDFFSTTTDWHVVQSYGSTNEHSIPDNIQFDFIFDYTFFCAIHPSTRSAWGEQMARLLTPGTGRLLTVIFPIIPTADRLDGPPFPVTVDDYRAVLEPHGIVMDEDTCDDAISSSPVRVNLETVSPRVGKELVCWWIRQPS